MTTDEIRLVIPAEEDFRPIAHLVTGGLAMRLDVTYDDLDDLQVGIEALLALRDDADELVVSLSADDGVLHASLGPFPPEKVHADDSDGGLDLRRVLETVCDTHEVEERDGGAWVELSKRISGGGMTRIDDKILLRRYHEDGDLQAREQLIEQYMSLVRSLARRYSYRGEQLEDLVQIGAIGLIKAIDRFDLERGVELTTYATPNIIGEIKRHFRDKGWSVRVPRGLQELNVQLSRLVEQLTVQLSRSPTIPELAKAAGVEEEEVLEALESGRAYTSLSLSVGRRGRRRRRPRPARVARHRGAPVRGLGGPRRARAGLQGSGRAGAEDPPAPLLRGADAVADRAAGRDLADARLPPDPALAREDPRDDRRGRRVARALARQARGRSPSPEFWR